ncbi:MAG TPA: alginate export family protein [Steroidobacteraceae bacterium]|nr:alginate export family protein [Steroidobacteraceae bacterium]
MHIKAGSLLALALLASTTCNDSCAQDATPLLESFRTWKPIIDARMRAELVDQTPLAEDAEAATLRLRAGFESAKAWNTALLAEGEFVTPFDGDYRPDPARPTRTAFPVVADPESYEANRLQLTNTTLPGTTLTLGRQRIALDDQRFVGNGAWRQNEQTFDAVRVVNKSVPTLTVDATYLDQVNRAFGPDSPQGRWHGDGWLGNVAWQLPIIRLTTFAYVLDFEPLTRFPGLSAVQAAALNPERVSTATYGARLSGERAIASCKLGYAASYAQQSDYGSNPLSFDLDYYSAEMIGTFGRYGLTLGNEVLQGDGTTGFATPLATLHPFNGWADKFLTTPANGLDDRYARVIYALKGASVFDALSATLAYHEYSTEKLDADLGTEVNVQLQAKVQRFSGLIKYAAYEAHEGRTPAAYQDTTKLWVQLEYVW